MAKTIWLCGDSITSGTGASLPSGGNGAHCPVGNVFNSYSGVLANLLGSGYDVWDAGYPGTIMASGSGSSWVTVEYASFWNPKPDYMVVMLGTNDSTEGVASTNVGFTSGANLILSKSNTDYWGRKVLFICPPWYDATQINSQGSPPVTVNATSIGRVRGTLGHSENYYAQLQSLADNQNVFVGGTTNYDFFQASDAANGYASVLTTDGLHPNDAGHTAIAKRIYQDFQDMLRKIPVISVAARRVS